jgi:hypothetical protein
MQPSGPSVEMPRFVNPTGSSLPIKPPFSFAGMTARVFPLRANIDSLQRFVDNLLNFIPAEVGRFRVPTPYVYLMMLDYGKLALEATNLGWLAQKEIMFCVPLEWYKVVDGRWVFNDWATVAPFIYVDDDLSMGLGRTVYGWPKTIATLTPTIAAWMENPVAQVTQATVSTMVFPKLYYGRKLEEHVFLQVERAPPISSFRIPPDVASPIAPWVIASNLAEAATGLGRDVVGLLRGLGIVPMNDGSSAANSMAMAGQMAQSAFPLRPNLSANTLNLKQFRRSNHPERYGFQALTNGPMRLTSFNRMGVLGQERVLFGDLSGGYSIKLHQWPSLPIVDALGLQVARRWIGADVAGAEGIGIVELKPVLPFWYDVNMEYLGGSNLVRRDDDGVWHEDSTGRRFEPARDDGKVSTEELRFNTTLSSTIDSVAGPFVFTEASIRVLPLLASREKLERLLDAYLNEPLTSVDRGTARERFTLWSADTDVAYVYLTVTNIGGVTSTRNNIGDWADFELAFLVPVKHEREVRSGEWELLGVGLVPAFTFVDNTIAATARSEVLGIPTTRANFVKPESVWMDAGRTISGARQQLLEMHAEVLPVIGEGQQSQMRKLVELVQGAPGENVGEAEWRVSADEWCALLRKELERKKGVEANAGTNRRLQNLLALALELLGNRQSFALYTMKQFRDVGDPDRACYQSVVRVPRSFTNVYDVREIEEPLIVRLYEFPTQPIVEALGLVGQNVSATDTAITWELQPVRPFTLRVTMEEGLGERILHHTADGRWRGPDKNDDDPTKSYLDEEENIKVGRLLVAQLDEGDPRRMAEVAYEFSLQPDRRQDRLRLAEAKAAIERIDPQLVVEMILSREWGNFDENAHWRQGRRELVVRHANALAGISPDRLPEVEKAFFTDALSQAGYQFQSLSYGGTKTLASYAEAMIGKLTTLIELTAAMDSCWNRLDEYGVWRNVGPPPFLTRPSEREIVKKILEGTRDLLDALTELGAEKLIGDAPAPEIRAEHRVAANMSAFQEIRANEPIKGLGKRIADALDGKASQVEVLEQVWHAGASILELATLARQRSGIQRETLFTLLSGASEKPDFVVRRDAAGPERDRLFPLAESFDEDWYAGPAVAEASVGASKRSRKPGQRPAAE